MCSILHRVKDLTDKIGTSRIWNIVVCLLLFYAIAKVFQLYHGGDMMPEMRRRKPEPTLLLTQGIFNPPRHTGMV